jgi:Xaa-Pro aminopeptidase
LQDKEFNQLINSSRAIKTECEISKIKQAQSITDKTFEYILNFIKAGKSEKEIAIEIDFFMRKNGADEVAFETIVASGENSSMPHATPTDRILENGDFVIMDFGASVEGYKSDMTRTVAIGSVSEEMQKVYDTVLKAQCLALDMIKPNQKCCDIDKIARDFIDNAGYKGLFGHSLGHSVGLEIHETPSFSTKDATKIASNMIMTVEPGIYLEGSFGVRIEDLVLICNDGVQNLTKSKKELLVL